MYLGCLQVAIVTIIIEFGISVYITAQLSISDVHETSLALYVTCKVIIIPIFD